MFSVSYAIPWAVRPRSHRLLLDLPVRTDTSTTSGLFGVSGVLGVVSDPYRFVRCEICGRSLSACRCDPGRDY